MKLDYLTPETESIILAIPMLICQVSGDGNIDDVSDEDWGVL